MKKKIVILGSTGSIGKNLFEIIKKEKKKYEILLLSSNTNYKLLLKQANLFNVKNLILTDKKKFNFLIKKKNNKKINIYNSFDDFNKIFKKKKVDYTMSAISGLSGLKPTMEIIKHSKNIAIANKEAIICAWNLISKELKKRKTNFIPVDSEHFSIWYAAKEFKNIERVIITASGGPFKNLSLSKFKSINVSQALKHPNWKMGKKITIDSATMMNKVFEIIEAKNIFNLRYNQLSILLHPHSYIHALVKFSNGMIKLVAHDTDMKIPIFNTLNHNFEKKFLTKKIDINKINNLDFNLIDPKRYPCIKALNFMPNNISMFETILVSANDELVGLFLNNKIKFNEISIRLIKLLKNNEFSRYKLIKPKSIKDIIELNSYVRLKINPNSI